MDAGTIITSVISSLGITTAGVWALGNLLIRNKLDEQLENKKAKINGKIKQQVEEYLGEKAAEREYQLEAKKRLYTAIGPLKFQLLLAARDCASRIINYHLDRYDLSLDSYYGISTVYRLLKPISIAILIEKQIAYADFSVDPSAIQLLRFKRAVFSTFTGDSVILNHPQANWNQQEQHIFYDNLTKAVNALIIEGKNQQLEIMDFEEFEEKFKKADFRKRLEPLPRLLTDFSPESKPLFWARIVCFGYVCNELLKTQGEGVGFKPKVYETKNMLKSAIDTFFEDKYDLLLENYEKTANTSL